MLSTEQIKAMRATGAEIGEAWARVARESGVKPDPGYDFGGDHAYVKERARAVGIAWEGHQPDEDAREVWLAVREGYMATIGGQR